jgi:hypothetical protein
LAAELKWRQFHYGPVDGSTWLTLGEVYRAAVEARLDQKPLLLYPGGGETTVEAEYLKALIFHASAMDNLKPLQIEIAERFIGYFLPFFSLAPRAPARQRVLGGCRQTAAADAPGEEAGPERRRCVSSAARVR